jgi:hypothetical protein
MPWVRRYEKMGHAYLQAVLPLGASRAMPVVQANKSYTGMKRNDPKSDYSCRRTVSLSPLE